MLDAGTVVVVEFLQLYGVPLRGCRPGPQEGQVLGVEDPHHGPDGDQCAMLHLDVVPGVLGVPVKEFAPRLQRGREDRLLDFPRWRGG